MAKAHASWTVLTHGPLEKLSERVWRLEGSLERMPLQRVMTIARRSDDALVVHNPICVEDGVLDRLGTIATLVVPNGWHRLDAKVFHERYPAARVICPPGARDKVAEVVPVTATYADEPADPNVWFETLDGVRGAEGAMFVRDGSGVTIVLNDIVFNMPHRSGMQGFILRHIMGSSGGPKITRIGRWFVAKDKPALKACLERLASTPDLTRIVVSHHEVIDQEPGKVLSAIAARL